MASDWAAKLANAAPTQDKPTTNETLLTQAKQDKKVKSSRSTSRTPPPPPPSSSSSFNGQEIKQFLQSHYQTYLAKAQQDKDGEQYKVYRSLESSNQWETQVRSNPKNVLRNRPQSNTIDILFEINRSIYQQRQVEKK
ncbi:hypothetical protein CANMA_003833 [Candida margitis]|uniref:uncharacterized protein n=1 Tax=Candida margitis TaxID=1775924 RepID=UPI002226F252|nr:uncharacterized protein CANMA_003833 [Candida margitis]KAI5961313.1 hypothetical protein CANMA_003833 [Candida margitis]